MSTFDDFSESSDDPTVEFPADEWGGVSARRDATVVYLVGDLDAAGSLAAQAMLATGLDDARDRKVSALHVDLAGVGIVDSTGLSALVRARRDARDAGLGFAVVDASPTVRRLLAITRLDDVFNLTPASNQ